MAALLNIIPQPSYYVSRAAAARPAGCSRSSGCNHQMGSCHEALERRLCDYSQAAQDDHSQVLCTTTSGRVDIAAALCQLKAPCWGQGRGRPQARHQSQPVADKQIPLETLKRVGSVLLLQYFLKGIRYNISGSLKTLVNATCPACRPRTSCPSRF